MHVRRLDLQARILPICISSISAALTRGIGFPFEDRGLLSDVLGLG